MTFFRLSFSFSRPDNEKEEEGDREILRIWSSHTTGISTPALSYANFAHLINRPHRDGRDLPLTIRVVSSGGVGVGAGGGDGEWEVGCLKIMTFACMCIMLRRKTQG